MTAVLLCAIIAPLSVFICLLYHISPRAHSSMFSFHLPELSLQNLFPLCDDCRLYHRLRLKQINQGLGHERRGGRDVLNECVGVAVSLSLCQHKLQMQPLHEDASDKLHKCCAFQSIAWILVHVHLCACLCLHGKWVLCMPGPAMVRCVSDDGCGGDLWGLHCLWTVWSEERHPWNPSSPWSAGIHWPVPESGAAQHQQVRWETSLVTTAHIFAVATANNKIRTKIIKDK